MNAVGNDIIQAAEKISTILQRRGKKQRNVRLVKNGQDSQLPIVHQNVTKLALGYYMSGKAKYAEEAAEMVKSLYLDPKTRIEPTKCLRSPGKKGHGATLGSLWYFLDAVRILEYANFLNEKDQSELRTWFSSCFEWLENSEDGLKAATAKDHMGLYSDIQAVALAAYTDKADKMVWYLETSIWRMRSHFTPFGEVRNLPSHSGCEKMNFYSLYGWTVLARLGQAFGRDLWKESKDNSGETLLCRATQFVVPYFLARDKCTRESISFNDQRWWGLTQKGKQHCSTLAQSPMVIPTWFPQGSQLPPKSRFAAIDTDQLGMAPFDGLGA